MKRHPMIGRIALAVALVAGIAVAAQADIITNGSFETAQQSGSGYYYLPGNIDGWTFESQSGVIQPPSGFNGPNPAADGTQYAFLQNNAGAGKITQTITLPQDGLYWFTAQQASRESPTSATYAVQLDGATIGTGSAYSQAFSPNSFQFSSTAGTHTLSLLSTGPAAGDRTTFIDKLAINPDMTNGFFFRPFSGDADSGISSSKTYTHAIDFNGGTPTINGVTFVAGGTGDNPTLKYNLANTGNVFGGFGNNLIGDLNGLAQNFFYDGGSTETLTLTGLTPNTTYRATFYNVGFGGPGGRVGNVSDSLGASLIGFDENFTGSGNGNLLVDTYTTAASGPNSDSITFSFGPYGGDSFHHYGFTNEVVPEPSTLALFGLGSLGLAGFAWRRRKA